MTRWKAIPWLFGVAIAVVSLLGANRLLNPDGTQPTGSGGAAKDTKLPPTGGTIALGYVDSDPPPVRVGPPGIGMQLVVKEVFVKDGDDVSIGTKLVQFDDSIFLPKLEQAKAEHAAALADKAKAQKAKEIHAVNLVRQQDSIKATEDELRSTENVLKIARDELERVLNAARDLDGNKLTESAKQKRRDENLEILALEARATGTRARLADERKKLEALQLNPVDADIAKAEAQLSAAKGRMIEAQSYIDACLVKARGPGIVEHVSAAGGMTFGPSTREPLLRLIPTEKRIVRAEVEAEFAYKVADKVGKKAVVYDANNFTLTYEGTVTRVATAFLPKRSAAEVLTATPTLVLECLIEVNDPAPPGKPPLRVGQPVRVAIQ